uniref:Uncharacterized protein n=1 Tax=Molossus molossus TaxID=27622 RepID=A0A7J8HCS1_MOLMO|nr:hypothetical protein HJG59_011188 [Molossus molossus]
MLASLSTGGSEQQECPTALPGHPRMARDLQGLQGPAGGPGPAELLAGEGREVQAGSSGRFPGTLEERKSAFEAPKASKAAWPGSPSREKAPVGVSAAQQETALQRLLELHGAARRRQQQDRQLQRLRVLERLCIARNRHSRVHPLELPPSPAKFLPPQDVVGQRRALREQLEQVHQKRTGQLRALRARNTQNFQQLLCPSGAEKPTPGEERSFPCNHH